MRPALPAELEVAAGSDIGRVRATNQDRAGALVHPSGWFALLLVCDGIGGLPRGGEASELLAKRVLGELRACRSDPVLALDLALRRAHREIVAAAGGLEMGTTVAAALLLPEATYVVHAGDSRVYRLRGGRLRALTGDDSFVMEEVRAGRLGLAGVATHPHRNIITRAIGIEPGPRLTWRRLGALRPGDRILACSDGLHGAVAEAGIAGVLGARLPAAELVGSLIERANQEGGPDNIAVSVASRAVR